MIKLQFYKWSCLGAINKAKTKPTYEFRKFARGITLMDIMYNRNISKTKLRWIDTYATLSELGRQKLKDRLFLRKTKILDLKI